AALIPRSPGNVSAYGLLTVDLKTEYALTRVQRHDRLDLQALGAAYAALEAQAREALRREGRAEEQLRFVRAADLRYFGQAWEVRVEVPEGELDRALADAAVERFHAAHEKRYGYCYRPTAGVTADQPRQWVEWVSLRVTGISPLPRPALRAQRRRRGAPGVEARARTAER